MSALQGEFAMERLPADAIETQGPRFPEAERVFDEDPDYATLFVIREPRLARKRPAMPREDAP
jgi:hypothetical protein